MEVEKVCENEVKGMVAREKCVREEKEFKAEEGLR